MLSFRPFTLEGTQLTLNLKSSKFSRKTPFQSIALPQVKTPRSSVSDPASALPARLQYLRLDEKQASFIAATISPVNPTPNDNFEDDFEDAWKDLEADDDDAAHRSKIPQRFVEQQTRHSNQGSQLEYNIALAAELGPSIKCYKCGWFSQYQLRDMWMPDQQQPNLVAPNSKATQTHLNIATCVKCSSGQCLPCGKAPHLTECIFADTRIVWNALLSVDTAVVNFRYVSPILSTVEGSRDVYPVLLEALTTILAVVPRSGPLTFGLYELLHNSLILDLIADIMRDMTVANIQLSPLLIQTWEFLHMIAEHSELVGLFFQNRHVLNGALPGLQQLAFPLVLLPIQQASNIKSDVYPAKKYTFWPLLQKASDVANQYLQANHDDVWSAAMVAQRVLDVYAIVARSVAPNIVVPRKIHRTQHEAGYAAGVRDLCRLAVIRKIEAKKKIVQEESSMEIDPPRKKRGSARQEVQGQDQNGGWNGEGGKRIKAIGM
ncbi:633009c4-c93b-4b51-bb86-5c68c69d1d8b [Sclerotinia trifoliorum]|uniref:633009c4-c93b-4b51-bb86-5c68c69d1d8b n=1 Tax=Sclerotinia trifoliorum TaxID=28548 RepID=A0A8H2VU12_9HELO|nr:633009c4-c93b-4b51-bb86-5c68c69d1d8b [Sclerotinia trifoliorum]